MLYIRVPITTVIHQLNHTHLSIYVHLLLLHFRFCGTGRQTTFFITDRALAKLLNSSTSTIYKAKKLLKSLGLIDYSTGEGNVTTYKINFPSN